jgi:branched-chain amino acid transport system permease protein
MIYAIFALSLELLVGGTGLVCFGHAAFFGIGAYAAVLLSPEYEPGSLLWLLPAAWARRRCMRWWWARCRCAPRACTSSWSRWPSRRWPTTWCTTRRWAAAPTASTSTSSRRSGGWSTWTGGDHLRLHLGHAAAGLRLLALLLRSRFGRALAGIRVNEQRMRATGFATYPYKLAAFTLSGAIAGLAGFLFAVKDGFVNPELLSWHLSGAVLIMIILGGIGHLRGALIGAFAYALLQEFFKSEAVFGSFAKHWHLGLG